MHRSKYIVKLYTVNYDFLWSILMLKSRKLAPKLMINHFSSIILYEEKMYVYMYLPVTPQYYNFFEGNL